MTVTNWAGNVSFEPTNFYEPRSVAELQSVVAASRRCRVIGTGHSFSPLIVTDHDLVSVAHLPQRIEIDREKHQVRVSSGIRYGELAATLHANGFALANLGSLPHISVAGACSTGTHGSGDRNGCLATSVRHIELITATGDIVDASPQSHPDTFAGHVVSLGTLGIVSSLTLEIEPTYDVTQVVYDDMDFDSAIESLDELFGGGYSVSLFTAWSGPVIDQVWRKRRATEPVVDGAWFGAVRAESPRHPVPTMAAAVCTQQLDVIGPWHERLPHFRLDFTPSAGDELQSEYLIDRANAAAALRCLHAISPEIAPVLLIGELRSVAADHLWLSPAYGRESLAIHFTWKPDPVGVSSVLRSVEETLAPFSPRPHWGKIFSIDPEVVAASYPRFPDAVSLAERYDPNSKFVNGFTATHIRHAPALG